MRKIISRFIQNSYSPLPSHIPKYVNDSPSKFEKSKLPNGVKIITETARFPNCIHLGFVLSIGSRNDPYGHLEVYKELFLKSRSKTDQFQYSVLELSGCDITMTIDRETIYIHANCLEEHLNHVLPALKTSIFSKILEKDTKDAWIRYLESPNTETIEGKFKNSLLMTAYSNVTLGIQHPCSKSTEITHSTMESFISDYFTADRLTIAAAGVKDHDSFLKICDAHFKDIPVSKKINKEHSLYTGGLLRCEIDEEMAYATLGFQGGSFTDQEMPALVVLRAIIGEGGGFSTGGPGKGMHSRAYTKILPYGFLESVKAINHNFTDSGVFAVSLVGLEKYSEFMPDLILKEMVELLNVNEEELARAKNIITREALINYQKAQSRIEDIAKNCSYFYQSPDEFGYLRKINNVTLADIKVAVIKLLRSKFTLTIFGKKDSKFSTLDQLYSKLGRKN